MANESHKIHREAVIILSKEDQKVFVKALLNPPNPSLKLRAAAQRYKRNMNI